MLENWAAYSVSLTKLNCIGPCDLLLKRGMCCLLSHVQACFLSVWHFQMSFNSRARHCYCCCPSVKVLWITYWAKRRIMAFFHLQGFFFLDLLVNVKYLLGLKCGRYWMSFKYHWSFKHFCVTASLWWFVSALQPGKKVIHLTTTKKNKKQKKLTPLYLRRASNRAVMSYGFNRVGLSRIPLI